jgi:glycosyltransferase involved in cell wall biosynthesis
MSVSVIIPTYNRATLLPFTLDAVLAQVRDGVASRGRSIL